MNREAQFEQTAEEMISDRARIMSREREKDNNNLTESLIKNLEDGKYDLVYNFGNKSITGFVGGKKFSIYREFETETTADNEPEMPEDSDGKIIYDHFTASIDGEEFEGNYGEGPVYSAETPREKSGDYDMLKDIYTKYRSIARLQDKGTRKIPFFGKKISDYERIADEELK